MLRFVLGTLLLSLSATEPQSQEVTGMFGGNVVLPCWGPADAKRVYWQFSNPNDRELKVVNTRCPDADTRCNQINPSYQGRSEFFQADSETPFSLRLHNLSVWDEGRYTCVVQNREVSSRIIKLRIVAPYSRPEVKRTPVGPAGSKGVVKLTCTSHRGYPFPLVHWVSVDTNQTLGRGANSTHISQDHQKLFTVTSVLSFQALDHHKLTEVVCEVVNSLDKKRSRSQPYQVDLALPTHSPQIRISGSAGVNLPRALLIAIMLATCILPSSNR
ncbi:T-lymphocyte activation antigen CD86-like [Narcine bancroftii]|uniref:T-lymphocyte activation antigen CD86-like n=1 Tax=Narcine bancroftii TaxID=1343680 RepID=UPI003832193E